MQDSNDKGVPSSRESEWVSRLASFLQRMPDAQAVEWDDTRSEISVATLGRVDEDLLRRYLQDTLNAVEEGGSAQAIGDLRVVRSGQQTRIEKEHGCESVTQLWTWRRLPWPTAAEVAGLGDGAEEEDWRQLAAFAAACGVLGICGYGVQVASIGPFWLAAALYIAGMVAGGWDAAKEAIPGLFRGRLDIHFLMLAVAVGASLIGAFGEGVLLLFLFSTAGALEHFALHRTRREIDALFRAVPKTAVVIDENSGEEVVIPVEQIAVGNRLVIHPGDTFSVDAVILKGESAADESSLTGEANPVAKAKGDDVFSGTQNLWGAVEARCIRLASQSSLQKIIDLIQRARDMKAPSQRFTDKFGPGYTVSVLAVTALMFFIWWLGFSINPFLNITIDGQTSYSAFYRAMTLLVVASPCALVLSIPSAVLAAIAWGARHGILFRGGAAIEQLAGIQVVALDKTGTLTTGDLQVRSIESFPPGRESDVLALAYTLEQSASHPIARAIVRHGQSLGVQSRPMESFRSLTGKGVRAEINEQSCLLGRRELLLDGPLAEWVETLPEPGDGMVEVWFLQGDLLGRILLHDTVRSESAGVLKRLQESGLRTVMLTGDRAGSAEAVGRKLGLSEVRSGLSPEDKVAAVRSLGSGGKRVAMVGDGINDAPCLAVADIAVAMGARGSDAALEQSDVVLMDDKIENFFAAFRLSQRARRVIRQNIAVSLGTIVIMVAAAVFGIVPITLGVVAHEGSTLLVCLNSMRLLR